MHRTNTRTTAWPAIANLMTIIVVLGFTVGLVAFGGRTPPPDCEQYEDTLTTANNTIDSLRERIRHLNPRPKCWEDGPNGVRWLFTVEIYSSDRYRLISHPESEHELERDDRMCSLVKQVNEDLMYTEEQVKALLRPINEEGRSRLQQVSAKGCVFCALAERIESPDGIPYDAGLYEAQIKVLQQFLWIGI